LSLTLDSLKPEDISRLTYKLPLLSCGGFAASGAKAILDLLEPVTQMILPHSAGFNSNTTSTTWMLVLIPVTTLKRFTMLVLSSPKAAEAQLPIPAVSGIRQKEV
jgi:hypothetical protein